MPIRSLAPLIGALLLGPSCRSLPLSMGPKRIDAERADRAEIRSALARSKDLERALDAAAAQPTPPTCSSACPLVVEICALTARICAIAARYPGDDDLNDRCTASTARCTRSKARLPGNCDCKLAPPAAR